MRKKCNFRQQGKTAARRTKRIGGCALAFIVAVSAASASAEALPECQSPFTGSTSGLGEVVVYRDIETCEMFTFSDTFYPPWHPMRPADVDFLSKNGFTIALVDRFLAGVKTSLTEYLNTNLNHYFLAAPDERDAIERGAAGPGWVKTGYAFAGRLSTLPPEMGLPLSRARAVHRFYGSVTPGPNSHFFTTNELESLELKNLAARTSPELPRWNYEGVAFYAFPRILGGACSANQVPVWRAFNGGPHIGVEANHRYSTDESVIDGMLSQGWIAEGVAFCVDVLP